VCARLGACSLGFTARAAVQAGLPLLAVTLVRRALSVPLGFLLGSERAALAKLKVTWLTCLLAARLAGKSGDGAVRAWLGQVCTEANRPSDRCHPR
jgi:hypothetical protein